MKKRDKNKIRVFVAEDHPVVQHGLKRVFSRTSDIVIAGETQNGNEVLDLIFSDNNLDVILLDINLPGKSGLEILRELKEVSCEVPVIVFSIHPEEKYGVGVFKAGASAYLNKRAEPEEIIATIRKVIQGQVVVSPKMAGTLLEYGNKGEGRASHDLLSPRELQIFRMIVQGKSTKKISENLSIRPATVSTYRERVLSKMNMSTNAELIQYALQNEMIP